MKNSVFIVSTLAAALSTSVVAEPSFQPYYSVIVDSSYFGSNDLSERSVTRGLLDVGVEGSFGDAEFFVNGLLQRGDNGSDVLGDFQAFSNIDEDDFGKVYEAWLSTSLFTEKLKVKLGQVDINSDFAYADNAGEFINSSMGFSPTIFVLPTYPDPAYSLTATTEISKNFSIAAAVSAGANSHDFADRFFVSEARFNNGSHMMKLGIWHHDGVFESLDATKQKDGVTGYWFIAEGPFAMAPDLSYYFQYGISPEDYSEVDMHLGIGIMKENFWGKESLSAGLGVSTVSFSGLLGTMQSSETAIEAFLKYQINEQIAIKPDVQFIQSPFGEDRNETVMTLRIEISG